MVASVVTVVAPQPILTRTRGLPASLLRPRGTHPRRVGNARFPWNARRARTNRRSRLNRDGCLFPAFLPRPSRFLRNFSRAPTGIARQVRNKRPAERWRPASSPVQRTRARPEILAITSRGEENLSAYSRRRIPGAGRSTCAGTNTRPAGQVRFEVPQHPASSGAIRPNAAHAQDRGVSGRVILAALRRSREAVSGHLQCRIDSAQREGSGDGHGPRNHAQYSLHGGIQAMD